MLSNSYVTIVIVDYGNPEKLEYTVHNLSSENELKEHTQILVVSGQDTIWSAYKNIQNMIEAPYAMLIKAGDTFWPNALKQAYEFFEEQKNDMDVIMLRGIYMGKNKEIRIDENERQGIVYSTEDWKDIRKIPNYYEAVLFKTDVIKQVHFEIEHGYEVWEACVYRMLNAKKKIGYVKSAVMLIDHPSKRDAMKNKDNIKTDWYLNTVEKHLKGLREQYRDENGSIPLFIQYRILYELKLRFEANRNRSDKQALNEQQKEIFFEACRDLLKDIDDTMLKPKRKMTFSGDLSYALSKQFLDLKYGGTDHPAYYPKRPEIFLDLMNYGKRKLVLDFACPPLLKGEDKIIRILWNNKEIVEEKTVRFAQVEYFSKKAYEEYTFRITIPLGEMKNRNSLCFQIKKGKKWLALPIVTRRYTSRITSKWDNSYWCFADKFIYLKGESAKEEIVIEQGGLFRHIKKEYDLLKRMKISDNLMEQEMYQQRLNYWKAWPKYHRKNIWLTFDKIYKGGDNGEYFYKYVLTRKDAKIEPVYLINEDAPDRERLEREGYKPMIYGSEEHRLKFLHAKMIFATHAGIYSFNHVSDQELPYLQDLMNAEAVCIQHGLSVQDLTFNSHRAYNNNKRYYCASKYEIENLSKPLYGYDDPSVLRLTGVPRYDGLINRDKKQILIIPTWRNYISIPAPEKNGVRLYFDGFKETEYYKVYSRLISDKKLKAAAQQYGYEIVYVVHSNISAQTEDYEKQKGVRVVSALDTDYEKILTESSLMVTDYSGVQFDFAYMRKPIVYYHNPKLPPHYVEGGFFYDTQGFGEICTEHEELVETLCEYMKEQCRIKPFYKERQDDFFAFDDHDNCKRIFEDALEYQKSLGK